MYENANFCPQISVFWGLANIGNIFQMYHVEMLLECSNEKYKYTSQRVQNINHVYAWFIFKQIYRTTLRRIRKISLLEIKSWLKNSYFSVFETFAKRGSNLSCQACRTIYWI